MATQGSESEERQEGKDNATELFERDVGSFLYFHVKEEMFFKDSSPSRNTLCLKKTNVVVSLALKKKTQKDNKGQTSVDSRVLTWKLGKSMFEQENTFL